jgi:hypothetical protein
MGGFLTRLEVLSPPSQEPIGIDDLVFYLHASPQEKPLLQTILQASRQELEEKMGKAFYTQTLRATFNFPQQAYGLYVPEEEYAVTVELPRSPVQSITSVSVENTANTFTVLDPLTYQTVMHNPVEIYLYATAFGGVTYPWWFETNLEPRIQVEFIAGYTQIESIPLPDKLLVYKLSSFHYINREIEAMPENLSTAVNARKIWTL